MSHTSFTVDEEPIFRSILDRLGKRESQVNMEGACAYLYDMTRWRPVAPPKRRPNKRLSYTAQAGGPRSRNYASWPGVRLVPLKAGSSLQENAVPVGIRASPTRLDQSMILVIDITKCRDLPVALCIAPNVV